MIDLKKYEVWFITGSQHLYGEETLKQVAEHSATIAKAMDSSAEIPVKIVYKSVLTTPDQITKLCQEANSAPDCIGLVAWMHTFSPAKMWINGMKILNKPLVHLHTQFNQDIPWDSIDMDFMNLNQSAHGGREFGFMMSRLRKDRKVIVGHWQDKEVEKQLGIWCRVAAGWNDLQGMKVARFGDNMREVAVTEGDKVEAQIKLGVSVNGYGISDLVKYIKEVSDQEVGQLVSVYESTYTMDKSLLKDGSQRNNLLEAARIELGLRAFLEEGNFKAITDTFEDLTDMPQLPGIAMQRLMADGYGFGAEGDWKTSAMLRAVKVMSAGLKGGASFMEDYTYHLNPSGNLVLGAHMLEICESIADGKPSCEIHPLSIGDKADPVRLVFNVNEGPALNASLMDMGNRFRLLVNEVEVVKPAHDLPKLPVARVLWKPYPNLRDAATAWIHAGGAHHSVFTKALSTEYLEDFAAMAGIELLVIDKDTKIRDFKNQIHWNEAYYHMFNNGL